MRILLKNVRGSFVNIDRANKWGDYGMSILIPKDHPQLKEVRLAERKLLIDTYGEGAAKSKTGKYCRAIIDGADKMNDDPEQYSYMGDYFELKGKCWSTPPEIRNKYNKLATEEDIRKYGYSGCWFHVVIELQIVKPVKNEKGEFTTKGTRCRLHCVMLHKEGDKLGNVVDASSEFADLAEELEDDELDDTSSFDDDFDDDDIPF